MIGKMAFINPGIAVLKTWQGKVEIALRAACAVSKLAVARTFMWRAIVPMALSLT